MENISLICCMPTTNPITAPLMKHSLVGTTHDQGIVTIPHAYWSFAEKTFVKQSMMLCAFEILLKIGRLGGAKSYR